MVKKKGYYEYRTENEKLEQAIRGNWGRLKMSPDDKTYYIIENLLKLIEEDNEAHVLILTVLKDLNEKTEYEKEEDKMEILDRINKKLKEIQS